MEDGMDKVSPLGREMARALGTGYRMSTSILTGRNGRCRCRKGWWECSYWRLFAFISKADVS
jgi:hypothetical protein